MLETLFQDVRYAARSSRRTPGFAAASAASRFVAGFLFELTPRDPVTLGVTSAVLALSALLAGYLPARRASRIDPAVALRAE